LAADWGPWEVFRKVNVAGVQNVMETALQHGIRRVVHISSVSVYGFPGGTDIDENSPRVPRADNPYITTKAEGETLALSYQSDRLAVTAIRPAGVYGPNDRTTTVQLAPALLSRQFGYVDGGRYIMAPIYIDNLVEMMRLAAQSDNAPGQAYNAMDDGRVTWKEYAEWMCEDLDCKNPWLSVPRQVAWPLATVIEKTAKLFNKKESPMINKYRIRAVMQDNHYSNQKAKSELGYHPAVSTRDGIRKAIQWYLKFTNPQEDKN
jgi:nucleoside-diphosphate-sugar epimerase